MLNALRNNRKARALAIFSLVLVLVYASCVVWTRRFKRRRGEFGFAGRKMYITLPCIVFFGLWMLTRVTHVWLLFFDFDKRQNALQLSAMALQSTVSNIALVVSCSLLSLRIWLIYFHVRLAVANEDNKWMLLITQPLAYIPLVVAVPTLIPRGMDLDTIAEELNAHSDFLYQSSSDEAMSDERVAKTSDGSSDDSNVLSGGGRKPTFGRQWSVGVQSMRHAAASFSGVKRAFSPAPFTVHKTHEPQSVHKLTADLSNGKKPESGIWFYGNSHKYGNFRWLASRLLYYAALPVFVLLIGSGFFVGWKASTLHLALDALFVLAVLCFFLTIVRRIPKYRDPLRLRAEVHFLGYILLATVTIYWLYLAMFALRMDSFRVTLSFNAAMVAMAMLMILTQTKWVIKNFPRENAVDVFRDQMQGIGTLARDNPNDSVFGDTVSPITVLFDIALFDLCVESCRKYFRREPPPLPVRSASHFGANGRTERGLSVFRCEMKDLTLREVLADSDGFRYFMAHLFSEWSQENLLCVIELAQFAECVALERGESQWVLHFGDGETDNEDTDNEDGSETSNSSGQRMRTMASSFRSVFSSVHSQSHDVTLKDNSDKDLTATSSSGVRATASRKTVAPPFPESVTSVKSSIAWNTALSKEQKFIVLVTKYIANEGEMAVNISFAVRKRLLDLSNYYLKGVEPGDYFGELVVDQNVFDAVIRELMRLMRDALGRFKRTCVYALLRSEWNLRRHSVLSASGRLSVHVEDVFD